MKNTGLRKGFTLAEILIAITVLGIVAVLTMPHFIAKYQIKQWRTANEVFKEKLGTVMDVMNTQQTISGHQNTKDFISAFSKNARITKVCTDNLSDCFPKDITWSQGLKLDADTLTTAGKLGHKDFGTNTVGIMFNDGSTALLAYNPKCKAADQYSNPADYQTCIAMIYDTSGFAKPNEFKKDIQAINVIITTCDYNVNGLCMISEFKPTTYSQAECMNVAGIKHCVLTKENWAAAVDTCNKAGMRLPTRKEVADIASYIYFGVPGKIPEDAYRSGTFNEERASKTPVVKGIGYYTSYEFPDGEHAFFRGFLGGGSNMQSAGANRYDKSKRAFCVK